MGIAEIRKENLGGGVEGPVGPNVTVDPTKEAKWLPPGTYVSWSRNIARKYFWPQFRPADPMVEVAALRPGLAIAGIRISETYKRC